MAYQSGEFNIASVVASITPGAAAMFNGTLFFLSSTFTSGEFGGYFSYTLVSFDLTKLIRTGTIPSGQDPINDEGLKDPDNWKKEDLPGFAGKAQPSLVATPDTLYAFINRMVDPFGHNDLIASGYTVPKNNPGQPGTWSAAISLLESDNLTAPVPAADASGMSAAVVGDNIIIVTCSGASSKTTPAGGTYLGVYDTTAIDPEKKTWAAQWHTYLPPAYGLTIDDLSYVWADWYSSSGEKNEPAFYLALLVESNSTPAVREIPDLNYWNLPMAVSQPDGKTSVTLSLTSTLPLGEGFGTFPGVPFILSSLKRDPAGRLRVWASTPRDAWSTTLFAGLIATDKPPVSLNINYLDEALPVSYQDSTNLPPTSMFYIFNEGKSKTTVGGKTAIEYPVYEFVFYGFELQTCQVVRCGTIQVIPGFSEPTLKQPSTEINIIAGIIDGPIPIPIANYQQHNMGSDTYEAGSITYGTTDTKTKERKVSDSWSVGFESSGEATAGAGPAWDISFKGGMGYVSGDSKETSLSYYLEQGASISFDKELNATLNPAGALRKVGVQYSITAYSYLDNYGPSVDSTTAEPADAPKPAAVLTKMVNPGGLNFSSYLFKPGDLTSYTPEAINAKMKPHGYDNYYGDVICKNAYPFGNAEEPFLSFTYSPSSKSGQAFSQFTSTFRESSWSLDSKLYGGISGGADIFGVEEFEMKLLVGAEYTHDSTESENSGTEWGIELSESWILPEGNTPDSVVSYDFRVFFLPVPSPPSTLSKIHWTEELMRYMPPDSETKPDMIDPNSGCWRITYAVTRIQYKDEEKHPTYVYQGSLDRSSVYQTDRKRPAEPEKK